MQQFAIVFTCSPLDPVLGDGLLDQLAAREAGLAAAPRRWLAAGISCETYLDSGSMDVHEVVQRLRAAVAGMAIDVNAVVRGDNRRKALLIADMDSTIIQQECIDELADMAGVGGAVRAVTERAMRGELDFEAALRERVGRLAGLEAGVIGHVIDERIRLTRGAKELVATMAANGAYCALISGGFTRFTSVIAERAGFHENRANILEVVDGRLTGRIVEPVLGRAAKRAALDELCRARGLPPSATLAVGDGANDLAMLEAAGLGVAYRAKPVVADAADAAIEHCDLTGLLYLQGYTADEIVGA